MKTQAISIGKITSTLALMTLLGTQLGCQQIKKEFGSLMVESEKTAKETAPDGPVILCLFDISGSTNSKKVRDQYIAQFNTVGKNIPQGAHLLATVISDNSWNTPGRSVDLSFPSFKADESNEVEFRRMLDAHSKEARYRVTEMVRTVTGKENTDMLEALMTAEKLLMGEKYGKSEDKRLIIFSDMVSQTSEYDFYNAWKWDEGEYKKIIARLKETERLPALSRVGVWVVGAGRTAGGGVPQKIANHVMHFWLAYFKDAGANASKYKYGPELYNYPTLGTE